MKICNICDYTTRNGPLNDAVVFCPECGNRLVVGAAVPGYVEPVAAPHLVRFGAGMIDCLISFVFVAIGVIPGIGFIAAALDSLFWLLRDIKGASPGKSMLGLEVRTMGGGVPGKGALMLRNLPFAPLIIQAIPVVGNLILPIIGFVILLEAFLVLITDRRLGDYLAGTKVMKKSTSVARVSSAVAGV
jgi:RDD family